MDRAAYQGPEHLHLPLPPVLDMMQGLQGRAPGPPAVPPLCLRPYVAGSKHYTTVRGSFAGHQVC